VLHRFVKAQWQIYRQSLSGQAPAWIAELLDQGKPEALIQFSCMNRFKQATPLVLRPDLLIGQDGELTLCELDEYSRRYWPDGRVESRVSSNT
jgi:hypothetical protein